jgi:nonribosomal peptide synthetase DhbF
VAGVLPQYQVPSVVVVLDSLPLTANGKLDRQALPAPGPDPASAPPGLAGPAPVTPVQALLLALFGQVLGHEPAGIDSNFFTSGGDSLLAIRLIGRIQRTLGAGVGLREVFDAPTPRELARRLDQALAQDPLEVLLPLRIGGERPPLFCFHPGFGLGWSFIGLTAHLPPDQPLYALQARSLRESTNLPGTLQAMADEYLELIRTVAPHGPFRLLGWSFGGVVAHAVATRLRSEGEDVDLLAMLDSYPAAALAKPPSGSLPGASSRSELATTLATTLEHNARLMGDFVPGSFAGDLLFFSAGLDRADGAPGADAWREHITGRITHIEVDSSHDELTGTGALGIIGPAIAAALTDRKDIP